MKRSAKRENHVPLVERAYQLARSGAFATVQQVSRRLNAEGYPSTAIQIHLEGKSIRTDLAKICNAANKT